MQIKIIKLGLLFVLSTLIFPAFGQDTLSMSLNQALEMGLKNSKSLLLSRKKIDNAVVQYQQTLDAILPTANASFGYNHAEIPANTLQIGSGSGIKLPSRADVFLGTLSLQELIFGGNKLKYAKESTQLLIEAAKLDTIKIKKEVRLSIISLYYNRYKLEKAKQISKQNIETIQEEIKQSERLFQQGLVTKNDVLRLQLQLSNIQITKLDIEKNLKVLNYDLLLFLGLPENVYPIITDSLLLSDEMPLPNIFLAKALDSRAELKLLQVQSKISETEIKRIKSNLLPTIGAALNAYYLNPNGNFIPQTNQFIAPVTVGATIAWNFGNLWTNKNKLAEASINKQQVEVNKSIIEDKLKSEINSYYQNYLSSVSKISLLSASINQAQENNRIVQSKYKNNIASVTDRIDADSQLFQAKLNYEMAMADVKLAYYSLLNASGE